MGNQPPRPASQPLLPQHPPLQEANQLNYCHSPKSMWDRQELHTSCAFSRCSWSTYRRNTALKERRYSRLPTSHRKCWTLALSGFTTNQTGAFAPREIRLVQQTVYSRAIPSYQLRSECAAVGFPRPNRLPSGVGCQNRRPVGAGAHQSGLLYTRNRGVEGQITAAKTICARPALKNSASSLLT